MNVYLVFKVTTLDLTSGVKFVRYSREFVINRNRYNRVWLYAMIVIDKKLKHLLTCYQLINLLPSKLKESAKEFYWFFHVCCCLIKKKFWKWKKDELFGENIFHDKHQCDCTLKSICKIIANFLTHPTKTLK